MVTTKQSNYPLSMPRKRGWGVWGGVVSDAESGPTSQVQDPNLISGRTKWRAWMPCRHFRAKYFEKASPAEINSPKPWQPNDPADLCLSD